MSIRRRPSGGYQARVMIDGRQYTATLPTREEARDWQRITHAQAITGMLPRRITVRDYATHWILGYDTARRTRGSSTRPTSSASSRCSVRPASAR